MGFFSEIWEFIKSAAKSISKYLFKIFSFFFKGIKIVVECIIKSFSTVLNTTWFGNILQGASFIIELMEFLDDKGADVDIEKYKRELRDMTINNNYIDNHYYQIIIH